MELLVTPSSHKLDLLNHPEYIEQNATMAFKAAILRWMNPMKKGQPSAYDAFVGNWKPTKNDTLSKCFPGFGTTINIFYGDSVCGQGDVDSMNNIVSHYQYFLDLMGVGREEAGPHDVLTCAEQAAFNPSAALLLLLETYVTLKSSMSCEAQPTKGFESMLLT